MITITFYTREGCHLCAEALDNLKALQEWAPHKLVLMDVDKNPVLKEQYGNQVPVVDIGPYHLQAPFTRQDLQVVLGAARDRVGQMEKSGDQNYQTRLQRGHTLTKADKFSFWLSNHYMLVFNLVLLLYVGLPFLAPTMMKIGANGVASIIYKVYSPLCNQFAFRSWFLFGEQPAYPRALANVQGLIPYEQAIDSSPQALENARAFDGNPQVGYKVAFCERDVAIYGAMLLFGLLFSLTGRRLKALPWYVWLILGIVPIAIDGFSQLPSLMNLPASSWIPIRESTPLLRTITGGLFGFTTAWFGYPYVEDSMREARLLVTRKLAIVASDAAQ
ncbi:MAG: DUF2085 domain-containing protein [Chloroflexi bacterium]|nr:DUF2085 domain-containing protein [Chloroflexota bacterium]